MQVTTFTGTRRDILPTSAAIFKAINSDLQYDLSRGVVPDPYRARAAYRKEPFIGEGRRAEIWRPWWAVQSAGWGDCEDWARWFTAWARQRGDASARIALIQFPAGGWHAVAASRVKPRAVSDSVYPASLVARRYPGSTIYLGPGVSPAGWWIVDVAYAHGMRDPFAPTVYAQGVEAAEREPREFEYAPGVDPYYSAGLEVAGIADVPWWVWGAGLLAGVAALSGNTSKVPDAEVRKLPFQNIWVPRYGVEWGRRLIQIANEIGIDPADLLAVMNVEAVKNGVGIDYQAENPDSGAYGLIQFMPSTLRRMGYTVAQVKRMTALEQLELVRQYFLPAKGRLHSIADVYTWVFLPARLGREVLTYRGERNKKGELLNYYEGNTGLDLNKNGSIEAGEPGEKARLGLAREYQRIGRKGSYVAGVRDDDPPLLLEWRKSTTAGHTMAVLGQAAGLTNNTRLLSQIVSLIRMYSALPPGQDVADDTSYIEYIIRRAYGLQGSPDSDPGIMDTLDNMAAAGGGALATVKPVVESGLRATSAIADATASAAQGVSQMPWYFWGALAAGGAYLAFNYLEKRA